MGVETAKNIILAGPASVDLLDDEKVTWGDLSSNFYCTPADVGTKTRAEASITKLRELNPYVKVNMVTGNPSDHIPNYSIVAVTELYNKIDDAIAWNNQARAKGVGFILGQNLGAAGYLFVDFGEKFQIFDKDGEQTQQYIVTNITKGDPGIVTVHEDKLCKFGDEDIVVFKEVQGMGEINGVEAVGI